jgi:uncharacterized protein YciI
MFFVVMAWDRDGMSDVRSATKKRHMAHLDAGATELKVLQSGPLLDDLDREVGSLVIVDAASRADVEAFCKADPYAQAGIVQRRLIHSWAWKRGNPYLNPAPATRPAFR